MRPLLTSWFRLDLLQDNRLFVTALALNAFGAGMFYPFALLYFTAATGNSAAQIGFVLTGATLLTLIVTPITGSLVDRFGARRMVVLAECLEAAGFVLYIGVSSRTTLFVAALLTTAGTRMYFTSISTFIAEVATPGYRDHWYGLVSVIQSLAGSVSGMLAAVAIGEIGLGGFRIFVTGTALCLLLCAWFYARQSSGDPRVIPTAGPQEGFATILRDRAYLGIVGANGLFMLASMMGAIGFALYATEVLHAPLWALGAIGAMQTAITMGCQSALLTRLHHYRRTRIMLGAGCGWAIAWVLYAFGTTVPSPLVIPYLAGVAVLVSIAQMAYGPTSRALAANAGTPTTQGRCVSLFELSWGLAAAGAPLTFGVLFDWHTAAPWLTMCCGVLLGIGLIRWSEPRLATQANRPDNATV